MQYKLTNPKSNVGTARTVEVPAIFVGKDVLELLSSSMYTNSLCIFREYVQNSVDSIDDAVSAGLLPSPEAGCVEINLDHVERGVVIRDNGIGLSNADFAMRMLSFGCSAKRGTNARGFRGVGRLSALGYVQQIVFRSRSKGDTRVMEATWDSRVIKRMLADFNDETSLDAIVHEAVTLKERDIGDYPEHFFEVELIKPRRIANDLLLNEVELESFVSQVCPCPFSPNFTFGKEIEKFLSPHGRAGTAYRIHINGSNEPVYRPYRNKVNFSASKQASLHDIKKFKIESLDGKIAAVGWIIHHDYHGVIPASLGVRGLRARVGNIQVGYDSLFQDTFVENRFCSWTIGEVHMLDEKVVPNGRRDEFESNIHYDNIVAHLRPIVSEICRACRVASQKRNRKKAFELGVSKILEKLDMLKQGAISEPLVRSIEADVRAQLSEMRKVADFGLFEDAERSVMMDRLTNIREQVDTGPPKAMGNVLECLPKYKRTVYREVFELIYDCSVNPIAAKGLVDKMLDKLTRP